MSEFNPGKGGGWKKFNLFFRCQDGVVRQCPYPAEARNLQEAEEEGRSIARMTGLSRESIRESLIERAGPVRMQYLEESFVESLTDAVHEVMGVEFIRAEPVDGGKSERKGLCSHGVRAKYCRACS